MLPSSLVFRVAALPRYAMAHDPVSALLSSPLLSTPPLSTPDTNDSSPSPKTRRHRSWEGSPASTLSRAESIPIFFDGARSSPERGLGLSRDVSMPDDVSMYSRGSPKGELFLSVSSRLALLTQTHRDAQGHLALPFSTPFSRPNGVGVRTRRKTIDIDADECLRLQRQLGIHGRHVGLQRF